MGCVLTKPDGQTPARWIGYLTRTKCPPGTTHGQTHDLHFSFATNGHARLVCERIVRHDAEADRPIHCVNCME